MTLINCPECSKEISDAADFCPSCGFSVAKNRQEGAAGPKAGNLEASESALDQQATELIKKLNRKWITILGVIVILVILAIAANTVKAFREKEIGVRITTGQQAEGEAAGREKLEE